MPDKRVSRYELLSFQWSDGGVSMSAEKLETFGTPIHGWLCPCLLCFGPSDEDIETLEVEFKRMESGFTASSVVLSITRQSTILRSLRKFMLRERTYIDATACRIQNGERENEGFWWNDSKIS